MWPVNIHVNVECVYHADVSTCLFSMSKKKSLGCTAGINSHGIRLMENLNIFQKDWYWSSYPTNVT